MQSATYMCRPYIYWHNRVTHASNLHVSTLYVLLYTGADQGFQVRGGAVKKKCAERREARNVLGYFV